MFLTGFVGRDPEERFTTTNKKVTSFPVGINTSKGGEKLTIWYKITCWGSTSSNILPHIKKGSCVTVIGDLNPPTTYQNKRGDIAIDMTLTANSISFAVHPKQKEERENDDAIVDFGDK